MPRVREGDDTFIHEMPFIKFFFPYIAVIYCLAFSCIFRTPFHSTVETVEHEESEKAEYSKKWQWSNKNGALLKNNCIIANYSHSLLNYGKNKIWKLGRLWSDLNPMSVPQVKDYTLVERLGSGSYATVYKGFKKVCI